MQIIIMRWEIILSVHNIIEKKVLWAKRILGSSSKGKWQALVICPVVIKRIDWWVQKLLEVFVQEKGASISSGALGAFILRQSHY